MNQWSATKNGTYLADARLLVRLEHERDIARGVGAKKSKRAGGGGGGRKHKSVNALDATDEADRDYCLKKIVLFSTIYWNKIETLTGC